MAHERGALQRLLAAGESGSPVAVETLGHWYGSIDEIEAAGCEPTLVHAHQAKLMMGMIQKTDTRDARGLKRLQRTGTVPAVWMPRGERRDPRELPRPRMVVVQQRTRLKNRLPATRAEYGLTVLAVSDLWGRRGRALWEPSRPAGPPPTADTAAQVLAASDAVDHTMAAMAQRMQEGWRHTPAIDLWQTLPGVGFILAVVMGPELGDGPRFPRPQEFASDAGTTPRVPASGGKPRYGPLRPDVNRYLKGAFVEAAKTCCRRRRRSPHRQVRPWYARLARPTGHQKALGAVARHLAAAASWILTKQDPYREPRRVHHLVSSTEA
jgi:transposase